MELTSLTQMKKKNNNNSSFYNSNRTHIKKMLSIPLGTVFQVTILGLANFQILNKAQELAKESKQAILAHQETSLNSQICSFS